MRSVIWSVRRPRCAIETAQLRRKSATRASAGSVHSASIDSRSRPISRLIAACMLASSAGVRAQAASSAS